jgi:hypothetical protein
MPGERRFHNNNWIHCYTLAICRAGAMAGFSSGKTSTSSARRYSSAPGRSIPTPKRSQNSLDCCQDRRAQNIEHPRSHPRVKCDSAVQLPENEQGSTNPALCSHIPIGIAFKVSTESGRSKYSVLSDGRSALQTVVRVGIVPRRQRGGHEKLDKQTQPLPAALANFGLPAPLAAESDIPREPPQSRMASLPMN